MRKGLTIAVALLAAVSCVHRPVANPNIIVASLTNGPNNLDPRIGTDDTSQKLHDLMYDNLVVLDEHLRVAPRLAERLECTGVRVGTVDKFQGQQAPVVNYSMATSRPEDAPRGMEFLYSLNRLNVATSRAQALVILVASPELLTAQGRTDRQLRLVNALCSFLELVESDPET